MNVTSSFPQASLHVCPQLGQRGSCGTANPRATMRMVIRGTWHVAGAELGFTVLWECRWGWARAFWVVCEIAEDAFSTLPGMTMKGCRECFNCSGHAAFWLLPQEGSLLEVALAEKFSLFFLREVS